MCVCFHWSKLELLALLSRSSTGGGAGGGGGGRGFGHCGTAAPGALEDGTVFGVNRREDFLQVGGDSLGHPAKAKKSQRMKKWRS